MSIYKYLKETAKYMLRSECVIKKYIEEVESFYMMPSTELEAYKNKRFLEIFRAAYNNSSFYNSFYRRHEITLDDIQSLDDITKLPVLTKQDIKSNLLDIPTQNHRFLIKNHTGGTTGTPLTVFEDWPALYREQAYFHAYRRRCGFSYGEKIVSLRGNLTSKDISLYIHCSNTMFMSSFNINESTIDSYIERISKFKPKAIEGYPSAIYNVARFLYNKGVKLSVPVCFTSSETLLEHQRELIEERFQTKVYDHYGTAERTIRISQHFEGDYYFEDPGYSINEYFSDHIITTSLINDAFPLIRYKVDDIMKVDKNVETGETRILSIEGRREDSLTCKNGSEIQGYGFSIKNVDGVEIAQLVQKTPGKVSVNIVPRGEFTEKDRLGVIHNLEKYAGKGNLDIEINLITESDLIYTKRNKFKHVVKI